MRVPTSIFRSINPSLPRPSSPFVTRSFRAEVVLPLPYWMDWQAGHPSASQLSTSHHTCTLRPVRPEWLPDPFHLGFAHDFIVDLAGHRSNQLFLYEEVWRIGVKGVVAYYSGGCKGVPHPPTSPDWVVNSGSAPLPKVTGNVSTCPPPPPPTPPPPPSPHPPHPNCSSPQCDALWGPGGCPDLYSIPPDLTRPVMTNATPAGGVRARVIAPGFEGTQAYHALYLPSEWSSDPLHTATYPIIVEYMGNGPWSDGFGDVSTGRPEDSNLGWGMADPAGTKYIWISMPFLTSDLGPKTEISTYWWGCPTVTANANCGAAYNITPTVSYLHAALQQAVASYKGDPSRVVITGWSRGAIATGAIGLYNDATSALFKAFIPYSHLDGDCGWVDQDNRSALEARWARLGGRPVLYFGECAVATEGGPAWLASLGLNGSAATQHMEFMTTGFANHNDAWVLRYSTARGYMRAWLARVLA